MQSNASVFFLNKVGISMRIPHGNSGGVQRNFIMTPQKLFPVKVNRTIGDALLLLNL